MLGRLLGWRRPDPGFEWHKYVRTTIKLRRDARREKAERLKQQAADGVKAAGVAAAQGAKVAGQAAAQGAKVAGVAAAQGAKAAGAVAAQGAKVAGSAAAQGAKVAGQAAAQGAMAAGQVAGVAARVGAHNLGAGARLAAVGVGRASRAGAGLAKSGVETIGERMITLLRPLLAQLARRNVATSLLVAGAIALAGSAVRARMINSFDSEAQIALAAGVICLLLAVLPRLLLPEASPKSGPLSRLTSGGRKLIAGALVVGIAAFAVLKLAPGVPMPQWASALKVPGMASLPSLPFKSAQIVEGRATLSGHDVVRVGTTAIRLADIEIPDREQSCQRQGNKRWRCGEAAIGALAKLTSGRALKCEVRGQDGQGNGLGVCFDGTTDINAQLVKGGHVFAAGGLMPRYAAQENEARAAKVGLWSGDAPERPGEWRNRVWEEARKRAPSGCPIKGQVTGSTKSYVLPWAPDYERVRVNPSKGGRWFCSEDEAISAGWKIASK